MLPISSTVDLNSKRSFFGFRRRCRSCIRRRLFLFHPSFIALLPCLLLVFLWFLLPEPYLPKRTTWDPKTRSVLQSSLKKLQREQATVQQSVTSRIQVGALKTAPKRPSLIHDTTNWIQRKLGFDDDDEEEIVATTLAPPRVLLLTAIPETPCRGVNGSHLTLLALKNKQEYARLLGWDFQLLLSPESTMNSMGIAPENRLKQVKQVMDTFHDAKNLILGNPPLNSSRIDEIKADQLDIRHAWLKVPAIQEHMGKGYDWIVWSDMDALFLPEFLTSFQQQSDEEEEEDDQGKGGEERIRGQRFPFERYEGKDLVLWGQWRELQNGDAHMGLNTGIMLIRDTESMRRLMLDVMVAGAGGGKFYEPWIQKQLSNYNFALFDQNGFAAVFKSKPEYYKYLFLENQYTINGYWKDWSLEKLKKLYAQDDILGMYSPSRSTATPKSHSQHHRVWVKHYMGCQLCSGINKNDQESCQQDFMSTFTWIDERINRLLESIRLNRLLF